MDLGDRTVGDKTSEVSPNDAVPCGTLPLVECSLDMLGNVLSSCGSALPRSSSRCIVARNGPVQVWSQGKHKSEPGRQSTFSIVNFAMASWAVRMGQYISGPTQRLRGGVPVSMASCCMSSVLLSLVVSQRS